MESEGKKSGSISYLHAAGSSGARHAGGDPRPRAPGRFIPRRGLPVRYRRVPRLDLPASGEGGGERRHTERGRSESVAVPREGGVPPCLTAGCRRRTLEEGRRRGRRERRAEGGGASRCEEEQRVAIGLRRRGVNEKE
jgi:hypothetical protein